MKIENLLFSKLSQGEPDLNVAKTFERGDEKKFWKYTFNMPKRTQALIIMTDFDPKETNKRKSKNLIEDSLKRYIKKLPNDSERLLGNFRKPHQGKLIQENLPIKNALNYSLFGPNGEFCGRGESRYMGRPIVVSETYATPGFLARQIKAGNWTVRVALYTLVTENCNFHLQGWFYSGERIDNLFSNSCNDLYKVGRKPSSSRKKTLSRAKGWLAGDLHLHSNHSDGECTVRELERTAEQRGLDFFVLTDHNTVSGFSMINTDKFLVIPGIEITTFYGHVLAIGVKSYIDWATQHLEHASLETIINRTRSVGGLVGAAHPNLIGSPICAGCQWKFNGLSKLDFVEIWRGPWNKNWSVEQAGNVSTIQWWDKQASEGTSLVGTGGSDFHGKVPEPNLPTTYVLAEANNQPAILEGIKQGRIYISSGPIGEFKILIPEKDEKLEIGSSAKAGFGTILKLNVGLREVKEPGVLRILRNGEEVTKFSVQSDRVNLNYEDRLTDDFSYRCEYIVSGQQLKWITNYISVIINQD